MYSSGVDSEKMGRILWDFGFGILWIILKRRAGVAELVDAQDLKSCILRGVRVRFPPSVPLRKSRKSGKSGKSGRSRKSGKSGKSGKLGKSGKFGNVKEPLAGLSVFLQLLTINHQLLTIDY